jgi:hypothetical protein
MAEDDREISIRQFKAVQKEVKNLPDKALYNVKTELVLPTGEKFRDLEELQNLPTERLMELSAKIKFFLDSQIESELAEKGKLSDYTRRWVESYAVMLDNIHKQKFGVKATMIHTKLDPVQLANMIRKNSRKVVDYEFKD